MRDRETEKKLDAADRFMDRPNADVFSKEGLGHLKVVVEDLSVLAQRAIILSGKAPVLEAVGDSAAFDLFWQARKVAHGASQTEVFIRLIESTLEAREDHVAMETLKGLLCVHLRQVISERRDLVKIGSAIEHLVHGKK